MPSLPAEVTAAVAWARADVRSRWRSLLALGLLVGVVAGLALAAVAGARRTDSSFQRLRERTNAADAIAFPSQVGVFEADWDALRRRPEVSQVARWKLSFGRVAGVEGESILFAPVDRQWLGEVDRPVVVDGRMFDPGAPDEVVVGEAATEELGFRVGSVIDYKPFGADQDDTSGVPPNGPEVRLRVVGVVRHVHEFLFVPGMVMPSPAFLDVHGPGTLLAENAMVRLAQGAADVPQLQRAVSDLVAPGAPIDDLHLIQRRVDTTIGVERSALLLLAAAIAVAGLMLVGQALGRSVAIPRRDVAVLKAMGFDRPSMALSTVLAHLVVAAAGALVALATAVVVSHWFPLGLASQIDPDRGLHADWVVLGPGIALVVALVLGCAAVIGWRLMSSRPSASLLRPSTLVARISRGAPLTVGLGTSMALRPGGDRSNGFVRPALVGAVVGVLGIVGTMTIDRGLNEALANPARAGVAWDATVIPAPSDRTETGVNQSRLDSIGALPDVAAAGVVSRLVSQVNDAGVPVFSVQPSVGSIALVSTSGRAPSGDDEAAIGPQTALQLNVDIGDMITVGSRRHRVRIVGQALFPADVHAGFDEGLWLTPNGLQSIEPPVPPDDFSGPSRSIAIRFRSGVDARDGIAALQGNQGDSIAGVDPVEVPPELTNLENVRTLPRLLAGFLALLALAAVAHLLATSVRWRRRDLATLRALGMTRGGARSILTMQGTAVALVGLTVGIPLGVAVGRTGWRLITSRVPLSFVGPLALVSILVLVPAALAIVNLLAVWPGHAAARLRPAEVLRAE